MGKVKIGGQDTQLLLQTRSQRRQCIVNTVQGEFRDRTTVNLLIDLELKLSGIGEVSTNLPTPAGLTWTEARGCIVTES